MSFAELSTDIKQAQELFRSDPNAPAFRLAIAEPPKPGGSTMRFIATDETADRYNTVILRDGWKLDEFRANPVFLWAHKHDQPPIGKVIRLEPTSVSRGTKSYKALEATVEF